MKWGWIAGVMMLGCGGSNAPPANVDAGPGDAGRAGFEPMPPAPVEAPRMSPCPMGWRSVADGTCDPWPESGHATCGAGEAHFPGEPGCVLVGPPCPADGVAADLPAGATVLYVDAAAAAGGDGTRALPFARIADALRIATAGTVVALARGTYVEGVVLRAAVSLWGACAASTIIRAPAPADSMATVEVSGQDAVVRNVTITGPRPGILTRGGTGSVHLENVVVDGARTAGIAIAAPATSDGRSVVVRDCVQGGTGAGRGVDVENGGRLELRRAVIERAIEFGVFGGGAGGSALLEDVAILETRPSTTTNLGRGIRVRIGTAIEGRRVVVERNADVSVSVGEMGATLTLEDAVVRDTMPGSTALAFSRGVDVTPGGSVVLRRTLVERHGDTGIIVEQDAMLEMEDSIVRDVTGHAVDMTGGRGISIQDGAVLTLRRVRIERATTLGVTLIGAGATATLEDVVIADTASQRSDGRVGRGLEIEEEATATATRLEVSGSAEAGILLTGTGTRLDATDVWVHDTTGRPDGISGRALHVQNGATASITRARFERNREVTVMVSYAGSRIELADVAILENLPRGCATTTCIGMGGGVGVGAYMEGASARLTRFVIRDAPLAGVQVALDGMIDLDHGRIERCVAGVNVQVPGYDVTRLSNEVVFAENERNFDSDMLPVPSPDTPL